MAVQVMLSPKEAAIYLGVKKSTILRYIKEGKLVAEYLNSRTIRISHLEIERLLKENPK